VATYTARLGLKRNDGSDPFKRQDFVDNYNRLDAAPGVHVCTSSTRPSWTSSQAGRLIWETDTNSLFHWNGTAFVSQLTTPLSWAGGVGAGATLSPNATANYNFANINAPRATSLIIVGFARFAATGSNLAAVNVYPILDSNVVALPFQPYTQWILRDGTPYYDHREVPFATLTPVTAGAHTVGARVVVSAYPQGVLVAAIRGVAFLAQGA
jgi:hypothetical protein